MALEGRRLHDFVHLQLPDGVALHLEGFGHADLLHAPHLELVSNWLNAPRAVFFHQIEEGEPGNARLATDIGATKTPGFRRF